MSDIQTQREIRDMRETLERLRKVDVPGGAGSAFPTGIASGFRFFRTDLGFECYYDGTRWLTSHEYSLHLSGGNTVNPLLDFTANDSFAFLLRLRTDYAPYFTRIACTSRVSTTNNATNFWTVAFDCYNLSFGAGTTIRSFTTAGDTVSVYADHEGVPAAPAPANNTHLVLSVQKTLTPGTLRAIPTVFYRLIVT